MTPRADTPAACPVEGCEYGESEAKTFQQVAEHVRNTDDRDHDLAEEARDWDYDYGFSS